MYVGQTDLSLFLFSDEALFHPSECVKSQKCWSAENTTLIHELHLHGIKIGVWCATSATRIIGHISWDHKLTEMLRFNTVSLTLQIVLCVVQRVFLGDRIRSSGLWPPYAPDVNAWGICLRSMLNDKVYFNNLRYEDDVKKSCRTYVVSSVAPAEFRHAINKVFVKCGACLRVEGTISSTG
jgi:hypothetical protein